MFQKIFIMESTSVHTFENVYDKYSPILYSIALEISSTQKEAEQILTATLKFAYSNKLIEENKHSLCAFLIKALIQTANEHLKPENNFRLKQFENTPTLQKFLCEQKFIDELCSEKSENRLQAAKQLRFELNTLRNLKESNRQIYGVSF